MNPNPSLWLRAKEIVGDALDVPPAQRAALIESRCADDEALLAEVKAFLHAASDTAEFLATPAGVLPDDVGSSTESAANLAGKHFGAYHLLREIGRGGMSVVYLAERADGAYQQQVAVKLMLSATAADAARRVGRERQALAALNHPNIARLVDGGVSAEGIPYLVMDFVDGERIDDWCNNHHLDVSARVDMALSVCAAVQHAHQQLIVHRDIKPANILITQEGIAKLLDFGVARLLESASTSGLTDVTQAGALLFTPRYASPEQVRGLPATVSTDVYGLGVLLYELLAGSSPFINISSHAATNAAAAMRAVLEDECRPASKVAEEFSPTRAASLRGDLDLILAKACARDVAERYATVALLADDLKRWLQSEPISVHRPSLLYRSQKFISRHKTGTALAVIGVIAVCAGIVSTIYQKQLAEERYTQALSLAGKVTTKYYDAIESLPGSTAVRKEMTADGIQFLDQLTSGARGDPTILVELATGYQRLAEVMFNGYGLPSVGDRKGADSARDRAELLLAEVLAVNNPEHHAARVLRARLNANRGAVLGISGKTDEALKLFDQSIAESKAVLMKRSDRDAQFQLARAYISAAQAALSGKRSGREYINDARAEFRRWAATNPTDPNVAQFDALLIRTEYRESVRAGDWESAIKHSDAEIALLEAEMVKLPDNAVFWQHSSIALLNSGVLLIEHGDAASGVERIRRAMGLTERIIAKDPVNYVVQGGLARMYTQLGRGLAKQGLKAGSLVAFQESIRRWETLAKRDLANYQVMQMGEAYWCYFTSNPQPANARLMAQALVKHADKFADIFAKPPATEWVASARKMLAK
ncbi:MAG: serine/threonine-protein kinase [Betaproteobacteria bacterium]